MSDNNEAMETYISDLYLKPTITHPFCPRWQQPASYTLGQSTSLDGAVGTKLIMLSLSLYVLIISTIYLLAKGRYRPAKYSSGIMVLQILYVVSEKISQGTEGEFGVHMDAVSVMIGLCLYVFVLFGFYLFARRVSGFAIRCGRVVVLYIRFFCNGGRVLEPAVYTRLLEKGVCN